MCSAVVEYMGSAVVECMGSAVVECTVGVILELPGGRSGTEGVLEWCSWFSAGAVSVLHTRQPRRDLLS